MGASLQDLPPLKPPADTFASVKRLFLSPRGGTLTSKVDSNVSGAEATDEPKESFQESALTHVGDILPVYKLSHNSERPKIHMGWYSWWLCQQLKTTPNSLLAALPGHSIAEKTASFMKVWQLLATSMNRDSCVSIDGIIARLADERLLEQSTGRDTSQTTKSLLFTIVGWQTMLYRGDFGSCPSTNFAIIDETEGYRGHAHMKLSQPSSCSRQPLHKALLGFGVLLPPPNYNLSDNTDHKQAFATCTEIDSRRFNASLLVQVGRFVIRWTDCLACHLELDVASNSLYLFKYPSFCMASREVPHQHYRTNGTEGTVIRSPLYACAQPATGTAKWAKPADITALLDEMLLSYRLLFGLDKSSRRLYRHLAPFEEHPPHAEDKLLHELCGRKQCSIVLPRAERKVWNLKHDFPILRSKLATLAYEMGTRQPRSWLELWRDKRDSAQWATFWVVIVFGIASLMLSAVQVVLQAVQIGLGR